MAGMSGYDIANAIAQGGEFGQAPAYLATGSGKIDITNMSGSQIQSLMDDGSSNNFEESPALKKAIAEMMGEETIRRGGNS